MEGFVVFVSLCIFVNIQALDHSSELKFVSSLVTLCNDYAMFRKDDIDIHSVRPQAPSGPKDDGPDTSSYDKPAIDEDRLAEALKTMFGEALRSKRHTWEGRGMTPSGLSLARVILTTERMIELDKICHEVNHPVAGIQVM